MTTRVVSQRKRVIPIGTARAIMTVKRVTKLTMKFAYKVFNHASRWNVRSFKDLVKKKPFCFSFKLKISRQISRPSFSFLNRVNLPFVGPVLNIFWCERNWVKLKWKELEIRLFLFFVFDWTEPKNNSCLKFFSDSKLLRRLSFNSNFNTWCHSFLFTCIKKPKVRK